LPTVALSEVIDGSSATWPASPAAVSPNPSDPESLRETETVTPVNFSQETKAWITLISLVLGTGASAGVTAFLGGAHWGVSAIIGIGVSATNVYHALADSPKDKARAAHTKPPFVG
jgi:hypothetical protein